MSEQQGSLFSTSLVRHTHCDLAVESARSTQRGVERVRSVGRSDHNHWLAVVLVPCKICYGNVEGRVQVSLCEMGEKAQGKGED